MAARLYPAVHSGRTRVSVETRGAQTRYKGNVSHYEDRQAIGQGGAKCPEAVQPPSSEVFKAKLDNTIYQCRKHKKIEMDFKTNEAIKTATFSLHLI